MPREIKPANEDAQETVSLLRGMAQDEKQLFFEVVRGSIGVINAQTSLGGVHRQEKLFRAHTRTALELARMFVQEYRLMKASVKQVGDND